MMWKYQKKGRKSEATKGIGKTRRLASNQARLLYLALGIQGNRVYIAEKRSSERKSRALNTREDNKNLAQSYPDNTSVKEAAAEALKKMQLTEYA